MLDILEMKELASFVGVDVVGLLGVSVRNWRISCSRILTSCFSRSFSFSMSIASLKPRTVLVGGAGVDGEAAPFFAPA